jgi:hypothetical protein
MDAQTRHQLKQNELAQALSKLRSLRDPRLRIGLIAVVAVLVVYVGYTWWHNATAASLAESWRSVARFDAGADQAPALGALRDIANSQGDTALGAAARLRLATVLAKQSREPGQDRDKLLRDALDTLRPAGGLSGANSGFAAASLYMQAVILETLGELQAAGECYHTLTTDARFESSPYRELANRESADLDALARPLEFTPGMPPASAAEPPPMMPSEPSTLQGALNTQRMMPEPVPQPPQPVTPAPTPKGSPDAPAPARPTDTPPPSTQPATPPAASPSTP